MGVVIWYRLEIVSAGLPVTVSNDIAAGAFTLDADIELTMAASDVADGFRAAISDLPAPAADAIKAAHAMQSATREPLRARVFLGYFDDLPSRLSGTPVMEAAVTRVVTSVGQDGTLTTTIHGQEIGGYMLRRTPVDVASTGPMPLDLLVQQIGADAGVTVAAGSALPTVADYTVRTDNGLAALRDVARVAQAPLVVSDNTVYIGFAVGLGAPVRLSASANIVSLDHNQRAEEEPAAALRGQDGASGVTARTSLDMTVLGDPALRVGRPALYEPPTPADVIAGPLRTHHVRHSFSPQRGYTCDVTVVAAAPGAPTSAAGDGAHAVVERFRDLAESSQQPAIDVGQVTSYEDGAGGKHLATLRYGQSPPPSAVAPSVDEPVADEPTMTSKPIASPFAWAKCGLVVPVYEGMRALLAHNRGSVNDAVVSGFLWSENPHHDRPESHAGDWWLCLPTAIAAGLPTGKGANDLIDSAGLRAIEAKGLRIVVGDGNLTDVGRRPAVPAAGEIVIEHESHTKITVAADGAVKIETDGKDVSIGNGSAGVKLSGASIELSGSSVEVK